VPILHPPLSADYSVAHNDWLGTPMKVVLILLLLISSLAFAKTSTETYSELSQRQQVQVLQDVINRYKTQGVEPKYTPIEYVIMINRLMAQNPEYMSVPVGQLFKQILIAEGSMTGKNAKGPPGTLLTFLSFFAGGTLVVLVLVALSGGSLPDKVESIIFNTALGVIVTTLLLWLYRWTSHIIFLILIPVTICAIIYTFVHQTLKNYHKRKFGKPSSPGMWLCRKCGTENENINLRCTECKSGKGEV